MIIHWMIFLLGVVCGWFLACLMVIAQKSDRRREEEENEPYDN